MCLTAFFRAMKTAVTTSLSDISFDTCSTPDISHADRITESAVDRERQSGKSLWEKKKVGFGAHHCWDIIILYPDRSKMPPV